MNLVTRRFYIPQLCLIVIITFTPALHSQTSRTGSLYNLIADIRGAMPGSGSYGFSEPTDEQMSNFRTVVDSLLAARYAVSDSLASLLDYQLYRWTATDNNRTYYVLMEQGADQEGSVQLGWGTYIVNPYGIGRVILEIPHPAHDTDTWKLGIEAYLQLNARYFLMAGTHRYANGNDPAPADVAHNFRNMFHVVHQAVSPLSDYPLQVHGFNRASYPGYPQVFLSNGTVNPGSVMDTLTSAISDQGYSVAVYDGVTYTQLGATTNVQGQWSRGMGFPFLHMELEYPIRTSEEERSKLISALVTIFQPSLGTATIADMVPHDFHLRQCYPNPFNPVVTIPYRLGVSQHIRLSVYAIDGRPVKRLVDAFQNAGEYSVTWNGRDAAGKTVPSGVYIYQLDTLQGILARKMTMLR
jgi:hypothetical protein